MAVLEPFLSGSFSYIFMLEFLTCGDWVYCVQWGKSDVLKALVTFYISPFNCCVHLDMLIYISFCPLFFILWVPVKEQMYSE